MGDVQGKFKHSPNISELFIRQWLSLLEADSHRLFYVHCLTSGTGSPLLSSREQGDIKHSIINLTEAILVPLPQDAPSSSLVIVHIFYHLTRCLFFHVMDSRQPEDVKCCIRNFRYLHGQWPELSINFPLPVTTALVHALAVQVELELGDVDEDIEEIADLCGELLNSDISIQSLTSSITDFARALCLHLDNSLGNKICLEKVTDCLRKAIVRLPGLDQVSMALARSLYNCFIVAPSDDDYEEGMEILDRILTFRGSGDEPSSYSKVALRGAYMFSVARFNMYGKPEYLEKAIYCYHTALNSAGIENPDHAEMIEHLSYLEGLCLNLNGIENAQDALSILSDSRKLPSFRDLITSFPEAVAITPNLERPIRHLTTSPYRPAY